MTDDEPKRIVPAGQDYAYIAQREREIRQQEGREEKPPAVDYSGYDGA